MSEEYKISLGVDVDVSDIQSQINTKAGKIDKIPIKVEIENLNEIKKQIQSLGDAKGKKGLLTFNTESLEASLKDVSTAIKEIKTSIGTLDSGAGMKSLLSSINQIATTIGKVTDEADTLVKSLSALSKKDFSINVDLKLGNGSNSFSNTTAYGDYVRRTAIPELRKQADSLMKAIREQYKDDFFSWQSDEYVLDTLSRRKSYVPTRSVGLLQKEMADGRNLSKQMAAYNEFINLVEDVGSLSGVNMSGVTAQFDRTKDEIIQNAFDIQSGVKKAAENTEESAKKLKNIFGGASIDADALTAQLDPIVKKLEEIRVTIDGLSKGVSIEGLTQSFDRLSETLENLMSNAKLVQDVLSTGNANTGMSNQAKEAQETAKAYQEVANEARKIDNISIDISDGNVNDLKNALKNLRVDDSSIENATKELNEMGIVAKSVSGTLKDGNLAKWEIKGVQTTADGLERVATITRTLGQDGWASTVKYSQALDKIAIAAEKVNNKLKSGSKGSTDFDVEINDVETKFNNLSNQTDELRTKIDLLKQEFANMQVASANGDIESLVAANERYEKVLQDVNNQLKLNKQEEQHANNMDSLTVAKENALLRLKNLFGDNSEAARKFSSEVQRLQTEINECGNLAGIKNLNKDITNLGLKVKESGAKTKTFGQGLKEQFSQYSSYFSVASLFMYAEQGLRDMFEQVKLIDTAMTELKKVTNETDAAYNKFLSNASKRAKELGTTIDGLVSSTADFARLGYSFKESQGLAEVANIYAVVGDEVEGVEGATESLISTMAAFKGEMDGMSDSDFAMNIIDKFNEVGNNFAISSGGIGEALERSASSLYAANNTLDESIALITAANTVVQDPAQVGTAFKTISMRIKIHCSQ